MQEGVEANAHSKELLLRVYPMPDTVMCAVHTEGDLKPFVFTITQSICIISPHFTENCYEGKMSWIILAF